MISRWTRWAAVDRRAGPHQQHQLAAGHGAQQALDDGGAEEPGRPGDGDALAGQGVGDHGHRVYHVVSGRARHFTLARATASSTPPSTQFGRRGYEATSLDALAAELGVTKQTILYWFPSKEALLDAVVVRSADDLRVALEAALAGDAGRASGRVETVMATVFRFAVRRPALLGLVREANRLGPEVAARHGGAASRPLVQRAVGFLAGEMDAGTIRRADPRLLLLFMYATVVGVATEVEVQRAVGLRSSPRRRCAGCAASCSPSSGPPSPPDPPRPRRRPHPALAPPPSPSAAPPSSRVA